MRAILVMLLLGGCAMQPQQTANCPSGAKPINHPDWGATCFWPEPPRVPPEARPGPIGTADLREFQPGSQ